MEREKEVAKLVNVLRKMGRMAMQPEWTGSPEDTAAYCVERYNRILGRLREIDPGVGAVFEPLAPGSSLAVASMACRQLAAYFEDEVGADWRWGHAYGVRLDGKAFKDFWRDSAQEIEDLGEFIRESVNEWARRRTCAKPPREEPKESGSVG